MVIKPDIISVGIFGRPLGYDGTIRVVLEQSIELTNDALPFVFIKQNGLPVPYGVQKYECDEGILEIKLDDYSSKEEVADIRGKQCYIEKSYFTTVEEEIPFEGFTILNRGKQLGEVVESNSIGDSCLISVKLFDNGKVVSLPLHQDFIINVNQEDQIIDLDIIEGLLDL